MKGQLTIFDWLGGYDDRRPCRYGFQRFIGQRVRVMIGAYNSPNRKTYKGEITEIGPYYTLIRTDDGRELIGTPTSLSEE